MEIVTGLHLSNKAFDMQLKIIFQYLLCAFCASAFAQTDVEMFNVLFAQKVVTISIAPKYLFIF